MLFFKVSSSHPGEQIQILIPKSDKETEYCIMNYNISIDYIGPHSVIFDDTQDKNMKRLPLREWFIFIGRGEYLGGSVSW